MSGSIWWFPMSGGVVYELDNFQTSNQIEKKLSKKFVFFLLNWIANNIDNDNNGNSNDNEMFLCLKCWLPLQIWNKSLAFEA